jgi:hypothetical protein
VEKLRLVCVEGHAEVKSLTRFEADTGRRSLESVGSRSIDRLFTAARRFSEFAPFEN